MTLLVCNPFQSTLRLNAFEITNTLTSSKTAHSLSPPQRPLCIVGRLEKGKKKARGGQWEGKREETRFFPLPIIPRALSIVRLMLFLLGYPAVASAERRGLFSLAQALNFVFKASSDAELFMSRTLFEFRPTQTKTTTILFFVGTMELKYLPRK